MLAVQAGIARKDAESSNAAAKLVVKEGAKASSPGSEDAQQAFRDSTSHLPDLVVVEKLVRSLFAQTKPT